MYCSLVFTQISFCSCLIVTITARVFDSFMNCPLVISQTFLRSCNIFTFAAGGVWLFHVLPFGVEWDVLYELLYIHICHSGIDSCLLFIFSATVFDSFMYSFMYCPLVLSEMSLMSCFIFTSATVVLVVAWYSYFPQGYLTYSCTILWCLARFPFAVAW